VLLDVGPVSSGQPRGRRPIAALALWLLAAAASAQTGGDRDPFPADTAVLLSIPNLQAAWKALSDTPLYKEAAAFAESPAITGLQGYREFMTEKRLLETEAGFALNAANLTQILEGFDLVSLASEGDQPLVAFIFRVREADRFRRLYQAFGRHMGEGVGPNRRPTTIQREKYRDIEIIASQAGLGTAIAELAPDRFVMGNCAMVVRRIVDQSRRREGLGAVPAFRAAIGGLGQESPHAFLYVGGRPGAPSPFPRNPLPPIPGLVHTGREDFALAAYFRIEPDAIRMEAFTPFIRPDRDPLAVLYREQPPGKLRCLDFVSSAPLLFTARNTFDGLAFYRTVRGFIFGSMLQTSFSERESEESIRASEADFRRSLGFDLREDLAPAIGPEAFLDIESVTFDPLAPLPVFELIAGVQVRDAARLERVLAGLEQFLARQPSADKERERTRAMPREEYRGKTITWYTFPRAPMYTFAYARVDDFFLVGLGRESVRRAIDRAEKRAEPYPGSDLEGRLQPYLHAQANELLVVNLVKAGEAARDLLNRLTRGDPRQAESARRADEFLKRATRLSVVGFSTAGDDTGIHTRGALVFRASPPPVRATPTGAARTPTASERRGPTVREAQPNMTPRRPTPPRPAPQRP
jgi:hypothetical protein